MKQSSLGLLLLATSLAVGAFAFSLNENKADFSTIWANGVYTCSLPAGYSELSVICNEAINAGSEINNTHTVRGTVTRSVDGNTYIQRVNQINGELDSIVLKNSGSYTSGNVLDISGGKLYNDNGVPYLNASNASISVSFSENTTGYEPLNYDSILDFRNNAFSRDSYNYSHFVKLDNAKMLYEVGSDALAVLCDPSDENVKVSAEPINSTIKSALDSYYASDSVLSITGLLYKNGEEDVLRIVQTSDISIYDYNLRNPQDTTILQAWNWSLTNIENNLDNIKNAGFKTIQISPLQPQKDKQDGPWPDQWWKLYQPYGFKISDTYGENILGDKEQLKSLTAEAKERGISIIVDVVFNHLAGGTATTFNANVRNYEQEIYDNNLYHTYGPVNDSKQGTVQGYLGNYPDLKTEDSRVQNRALALLKDYLDCGVRGFRFDAAKHIETPNEYDYHSDFWSNVVWSANEYAESKYHFTPYNYGEILGAGNDRDIKWYYDYMSFSDPATISNYTDRVTGASGDRNISSNYGGGLDLRSDKMVLWPESHDNYVNGSASQFNINKTFAIQASRQSAATLYLARPSNGNTQMGDVGSTSYKDDIVVTASNKFHNELVNASEYIKNENGYFINVRKGGSRNGAMIVNVCGNGSGSVNLNVGEGFGIPDGTYIDLTSGQNVTVSGGYVTANFGDDGVMALLQIVKSGSAITEGFGLKFSTGKTILATSIPEKDTEQRDQFKIIRQSFKKDDTFTLYNFGNGDQWVIDIDEYSFGSDVSSYITKGANTYTVKQNFTADIYLKFKYQDDQIYFDLSGLTLSKNAVEVYQSSSTEVTVSNYAGSYSATSSNTSIATVSQNGATIIITGVAIGNATITVTDGVVTRTVSVTVSSAYKTITVSWSENWIWSDGASVYVHAWGDGVNTWFKLNASSGTSVSFELLKSAGYTGAQLVRGKNGDSEPSTKWNKTGDLDISSGSSFNASWSNW